MSEYLSMKYFDELYAIGLFSIFVISYLLSGIGRKNKNIVNKPENIATLVDDETASILRRKHDPIAVKDEYISCWQCKKKIKKPKYYYDSYRGTPIGCLCDDCKMIECYKINTAKAVIAVDQAWESSTL